MDPLQPLIRGLRRGFRNARPVRKCLVSSRFNAPRPCTYKDSVDRFRGTPASPDRRGNRSPTVALICSGLWFMLEPSLHLGAEPRIPRQLRYLRPYLGGIGAGLGDTR